MRVSKARVRKATRREALAVCFMAWTRFEDKRFKVSTKSDNYPALRQAETEGWIWFLADDQAMLTADGRKVLADYGVPQVANVAEVAGGAKP
jgi:hypothetical protein